jgi:Zn-finger nucleic acid-binding protein
MAGCNHCGAPLAANTNLCKYCGTRNDVDLRANFPYRIEQSESARICPSCDTALQTIRLIQDEEFFIERCDQCYGMFFDRNELEHVLNESVTHAGEINREHIDNINQDRYRKPDKVEYLKCPECNVLMNRTNFGHRSGVVVDRCTMHGIWLENGELIHLLEWKKAGGLLLHEQTQAEQAAQRPRRTAPLPASAQIPDHSNGDWQTTKTWDRDSGMDIVGAIIWLIGNFFFK